jgi:hypothetical protein
MWHSKSFRAGFVDATLRFNWVQALIHQFLTVQQVHFSDLAAALTCTEHERLLRELSVCCSRTPYGLAAANIEGLGLTRVTQRQGLEIVRTRRSDVQKTAAPRCSPV